MGDVESTLESLPGVVKCNIDFENKVATVEVNDEFDAENAVAQLDPKYQPSIKQ